MIDLRYNDLPSYIECDGSFYALNTDFRVWIDFELYLRHKQLWTGIFADEVPQGEWAEAAIEFLESRNATPRDTGESSARILDYVLDGDYIVAAFQQAYGIDLTSIEYMHWHRFSALFKGLPDDTKMVQIMGYRGYKPSKEPFEKRMMRARSIWALPIEEEDDSDVVEWANEFFGEG